MITVKMSIPQWEDYEKALAEGKTSRAKEIMELGYQNPYDPTVLGATEAEIIEEAYTNDDIMDDVSGGMDNKEIYAKYSISPAKLVSIKKGAK